MFGHEAKLALILHATPPELEDENELLEQLRLRVGPFACPNKLLYHLRSARGKVHWAVNSYFREVLSRQQADGTMLDFEPRPAAAACSAASTHGSLAAHENTEMQASLQALESCEQQQQQQQQGLADLPLPPSLLEEVLRHLDVLSLLRAACTCRALQQAAGQDRIWEALFHQHWAGVQLPLDGAASSGPGSSKRQAGSSSGSGNNTSTVAPVAAAAGGTAHQGGQQGLQAAAASPGFVACRSTAAGAANTGEDREGERAGSSTVAGTADRSALPPEAAGSAVGPSRQQEASAQGVGAPASRQQEASAQGVGAPAGTSYAAACMQGSSRSAAGSQAACSAACSCDRLVPAAAALPSPAAAKLATGAAVSAAAADSRQRVSWRSRFKAQWLLERTSQCPRCGMSKLIPLVYGFPSPVLRDGMRRGKLLLGGDYLIERGHAWACGLCRSSYKCWPYGRNLELWVHERGSSAAGQAPGAAPAGAIGRRLYDYEL